VSKDILQRYSINLDIDEDGNFILTMISKQSPAQHTFIDKAYSTMIGKAFSRMNNEMKESG